MPTVFSTDGTSWSIPELKETVIRAHELVSKDGKTTLQTTNNATDGAHLILHGTLPSSEKYIWCQNAADQTKFSVDHNGGIYSNGSDVNQELSDLATLSATNYGTLAGATHLATESTIVKRSLDSDTSGTQFKVVSCERISASGTTPNMAVYDGAVNYVAVDNSGSNIAGAVCRFGKNASSNDFSGAGDGLEVKRDDNEILIQCQKDSATIKIEGEKNPAANYIEIKDQHNELLFGISQQGHMIGAHLFEDDTSNVNDMEGHSNLMSGLSLYVGNCRMSFLNDQIKFEKISIIPYTLTQSPYNITNSDLSGRTPAQLDCRQWCALARTKISDHTVKARNIFNTASDWVTLGTTYTNTLSSDAQTQINTINTWLSAADTDIDTLEASMLLKALKADPVFTGNMEITNSSADCTISFERQGHTKHFIKSHSDDYNYGNRGRRGVK